MTSIYSPSQRRLQDRFGTRRLADVQETAIVHADLTEEDRAFIESRDMLFLSTVDAEGCPTVSYKGGDVGFVRVERGTLLIPCYDGNGMFLSMGNIVDDAKVGLLFIDLEVPRRLRVHGMASLEEIDLPGCDLGLRVRPTRIFVNCPRYIHRYKRIETSRYVPDEDGRAPVAEWKRIDFLRDDLTSKDRDAVDEVGTIDMAEYERRVAEGKG